MPRIPIIIGSFDDKNSANAKEQGLQVFDKIVAVDSTTVQFFDEMAPHVKCRKKGIV